MLEEPVALKASPGVSSGLPGPRTVWTTSAAELPAPPVAVTQLSWSRLGMLIVQAPLTWLLLPISLPLIDTR